MLRIARTAGEVTHGGAVRDPAYSCSTSRVRPSPPIDLLHRSGGYTARPFLRASRAYGIFQAMQTIRLIFAACVVGLVACGDDSVNVDDQGPPPPSGTELWEQRVSVRLFDVAVGPDGSVYATGGESRMWLGKFAPNGVPQWAREGDESLSVAVVVGQDGGIYTATTTIGTLKGVRHVARYDDEGTQIWTLDQAERSVSELAPAPGGGVYAAGESPEGPFFQRIDSTGTIVWSLDEPELVSIDDVALGANGELLATGMGSTWWAQARDDQGALLWATDLGQPLAAGPFQSIAVDADGSLTIAAMTQNDPAGRGYVARLGADGSNLAAVQPMEWPPTEIVRTGNILVVAHLVPPVGVEARSSDGTALWSLEPDDDCWKTWALDAAPGTAVVALSECSKGARLVAIQP